MPIAVRRFVCFKLLYSFNFAMWKNGDSANLFSVSVSPFKAFARANARFRPSRSIRSQMDCDSGFRPDMSRLGLYPASSRAARLQGRSAPVLPLASPRAPIGSRSGRSFGLGLKLFCFSGSFCRVLPVCRARQPRRGGSIAPVFVDALRFLMRRPLRRR